jgi:hypothetical protein
MSPERPLWAEGEGRLRAQPGLSQRAAGWQVCSELGRSASTAVLTVFVAFQSLQRVPAGLHASAALSSIFPSQVHE